MFRNGIDLLILRFNYLNYQFPKTMFADLIALAHTSIALTQTSIALY